MTLKSSSSEVFQGKLPKAFAGSDAFCPLAQSHTSVCSITKRQKSFQSSDPRGSEILLDGVKIMVFRN